MGAGAVRKSAIMPQNKMSASHRYAESVDHRDVRDSAVLTSRAALQQVPILASLEPPPVVGKRKSLNLGTCENNQLSLTTIH